MNKEREAAMLVAANILSGHINKIDSKDLETMLGYGNVPGAFICGVRWADKNPESPWVNVEERMPESSIPEISSTDRERDQIKVMVRLMNGNVMQASRRKSSDGIWFFNIPMQMRYQITHWMPIPPVPEDIRNQNKQ